MFDSSSVGLSDEAKILVSFANNRKESFCEELIISFIYIRNNRGPSELPCGISQITVCFDDWILSIDTVHIVKLSAQKFMKVVKFIRWMSVNNQLLFFFVFLEFQ
jgi:hypothetical protein